MFSGKGKINKTFAENVFKCTICGKCSEVCQVSIDLVTFWQAARAEVFRNNLWPLPLHDLKASIQEERNVYNIPNEERTIWSFDVEDIIEERIRKRSEVGYFIGCVSSFTGRLTGIPESVVKILDYLSIDFTILGKEEYCCGSPYFLSGAFPLVNELVEHNVRRIEQLGIKTLLTTCAGCYRAWKQEYPHQLGRELPFEVKHAVEYLAELVDMGKLEFEGNKDFSATYHDPCELGRLCGVYEAPRKILESIPHLDFIELPKVKQDCECCGSGGVLRMTNPELALKVGLKKIKEIESLEVDAVISACPACWLNMDEAKRASYSQIDILDITQIVAQALGL
jgi:Fe-S oxidoreductase